jgi:hypothetical protein
MAMNDNDTMGEASDNDERMVPAAKTSISSVRETDVQYTRTPPERPTERGIHPRRSVPPLPDKSSE